MTPLRDLAEEMAHAYRFGSARARPSMASGTRLNASEPAAEEPPALQPSNPGSALDRTSGLIPRSDCLDQLIDGGDARYILVQPKVLLCTPDVLDAGCANAVLEALYLRR
jgi:hypothetical protein